MKIKTSRPLAKSHLEEVILVDDAAVGQSLDQFIGQGGFATIGDSKNGIKQINVKDKRRMTFCKHENKAATTFKSESVVYLHTYISNIFPCIKIIKQLRNGTKGTKDQMGV